MEARAHIKHIRISPIKLRTLVDGVRKMKPLHALDYLSLSQNRSAKVLRKAIKSALDNGAQNASFNKEKATFKTLMIDEGAFLKRYRAGSRGAGRLFKRKASHITVVISEGSKKTEGIKSKEEKSKRVIKAVAGKSSATKAPSFEKVSKDKATRQAHQIGVQAKKLTKNPQVKTVKSRAEVRSSAK